MDVLTSPIRHDGTLHLARESFGVTVIVRDVRDLLIADVSGGDFFSGEKGGHGECG